MNPFWNVVLGCSIAALALAIAILKLIRPGSPWHRRGAYLAALGSLWLLGSMGLRWWNYQQALSGYSRLHIFLGIAVYLAFTAKFCSARRWYLTPRYLRPLGFVLASVFPLAAFGMGLPFLAQSLAWREVSVSEVTQNPKQESFENNCSRCHTLGTAVEGLGVRAVQRWIDITQPMAWAGALDRESFRGALAAILAPPLAASAAILAPPQAVSGSLSPDPVDRHCLACHSRTRILQAKKNPDEWRQTVLRMQGLAQKNPQIPQITDENMKEILTFLEKSP